MVTGEKAMVAQVFLKKGAEALEPWCARPNATQGRQAFKQLKRVF
jgi:hypothetical protein